MVHHAAQRDAAAKQKQYAQIGIARHFAPAHRAKHHHQRSGNQRDDAVNRSDARCLADFAAQHPRQRRAHRNQHGEHAVQIPRDVFGLRLHRAGRKLRAQHHKQRNQHHGQQHQHNRQAVAHPAGEIQPQGFGGDGVGRRPHQSAHAADARAISDAQQHKGKRVAVFFGVQMRHQPHGKRQHHGGGGGVADPHGKKRGYGKNQHHRGKQATARQGDDLQGDFSIQPLDVQRAGKGKAAEKNKNHRVGKACQRRAGVHVGDFEHHREHGHQQRGNRDVHRFGEPQQSHE